MKLQYISDKTGATKVFLSRLMNGNALKSKFKGIEDTEVDIPGWHKDLVQERLAGYKLRPDRATDFESTLDGLEDEQNMSSLGY